MGSDERSPGQGTAGAAPADGAPVPVRRVTGGYRPPELLTGRHDLPGFECRSHEQAIWLREHARQSSASGTTRVFVVTGTDDLAVVAYYAWCMAHLTVPDSPAR